MITERYPITRCWTIEQYVLHALEAAPRSAYDVVRYLKTREAQLPRKTAPTMRQVGGALQRLRKDGLVCWSPQGHSPVWRLA